ncbi:MAG: cytochrome C oxidase subunit IV family protein [Armatimonadetes bacterium]|nr:cytochrome C oxidase subunit IV family protein [Armatimonadota bacterium]MDW8154411.1 cytochrome C oxidase subunit IV family protein [Armatimonadota bacterium]
MEERHTGHGYALYGVTWFWLLVVTVAEIWITLIHLPRPVLITGLVGMAILKAALIMAYFMHLRYERPVVAAIFSIPIAILLVALFAVVGMDALAF